MYICVSILSVCLPACLPVCLAGYLSVYLFTCLYAATAWKVEWSEGCKISIWYAEVVLLKLQEAEITYSIFKGTVMQIEKRLINDSLRVSKVSWKFRIPNIYNFVVNYPWNLLFFEKVAYFLLSCLFINKTLRLNNLKIRTVTKAKISLFVICVEAIVYLLLYNLHDCPLKSGECFSDFLSFI